MSNGRLGKKNEKKGKDTMYHEIENKSFFHEMKQLCGKIMQELCHNLKKDYDMGVTPILIGSGARNMILQNANEAVDLDYNLIIKRNGYSENGKDIKNAVQNCFNKVLRSYSLNDCEDSTSCLSSRLIQLSNYQYFQFKIDVAIIDEDDDGVWYRLIHNKHTKKYYWNETPNDIETNKKAKFIKNHGSWEEVRSQYLYLKNLYLRRNDYNHSSRVLYRESVNNVYNHLRQTLRTEEMNS